MKILHRFTEKEAAGQFVMEKSLYLFAFGEKFRQSAFIYNYWPGGLKLGRENGWWEVDLFRLGFNYTNEIRELELDIVFLGFGLNIDLYFAPYEKKYYEFDLAKWSELTEEDKKLKNFLTNIADSQSSFRDEAKELIELLELNED